MAEADWHAYQNQQADAGAICHVFRPVDSVRGADLKDGYAQQAPNEWKAYHQPVHQHWNKLHEPGQQAMGRDIPDSKRKLHNRL